MDTRKHRRRWFRRRNVVIAWVLGAGILLGVGSTWALERYVIAHVAISDVDAYEAAQDAGTDASGPASVISSED